MASSSSLPTALLAIYIIFSLPVIYTTVKHGVRHGAILGWAYLFIFCSLRIISSAMQLSDPTSSSSGLIANIGLSPLLLSTCGILHESRAYLLPSRRRGLETVWVLAYHVVVSSALAIVAAGASGLSKAATQAADDDTRRDMALAKAGMIILLLSWVAVMALAVLTLTSVVYRRPARTAESDFRGGRALLVAVLVAMPFLGIRVLTSVVYFFTLDADLNPVTGGVGLRVGLEVVEEIVVTLLFVGAGVGTRNLGRRGDKVVEGQRSAVSSPAVKELP